MVIEKQLGPEGMRQADAFFRRAAIDIEPVTVEQGHLARQAFLDFGKGRHRAGLNFCDCFAYALARALDEPLLFKGNDFTETDIRSAASRKKRYDGSPLLVMTVAEFGNGQKAFNRGVMSCDLNYTAPFGPPTGTSQ
jgi:hypothetical protein